MKFKSGLEKVGGESAHEKKNKKVQLLHWALVISKWVESFDSQNINDFYFEDSGKKDPNSIHTVQMQFRDALNEMEQIGLSPNQAGLNKHLQQTSGRINISPMAFNQDGMNSNNMA